jgi:hypothetical protein
MRFHPTNTHRRYICIWVVLIGGIMLKSRPRHYYPWQA